LNSRLSSPVEPIQCEVRVKELKNFGSSLRPSYSIHLEIAISVRESPDALHKLLTGTGIISRETIPFVVVSNFRGSVDGKPFYSATIRHGGITKRYEVRARDTGGLIRRKINYEPIVYPEELRLLHPAEFHRSGIKVLEWELHNYKHYFTLFISSKKSEMFDIRVKTVKDSTSIRVNLGESGLRDEEVPCSLYLRRLLVFKGLNIEEEVRRKVKKICMMKSLD